MPRNSLDTCCGILVYQYGLRARRMEDGLCEMGKSRVETFLYTAYARQGITGLLAFSTMYITSITVVRRRLYEFFLVTHICLAALTLGAFIMHWRAVDVWIYVSSSSK